MRVQAHFFEPIFSCFKILKFFPKFFDPFFKYIFPKFFDPFLKYIYPKFFCPTFFNRFFSIFSIDFSFRYFRVGFDCDVLQLRHKRSFMTIFLMVGDITSSNNSTWRSGFCDSNKGECNLNQSKDGFFVNRVAKNNN